MMSSIFPRHALISQHAARLYATCLATGKHTSRSSSSASTASAAVEDARPRYKPSKPPVRAPLWTAEESDLVLRLRLEGMPVEEIHAQYLSHRTLSTVKRRARNVLIKHGGSWDRYGIAVRIEEVPERVNLLPLDELASSIPAAPVTRESHQQVHSNGDRWTEEEINTFIMQKKAGKTVVEIHTQYLPHRTYSAVWNKNRMIMARVPSDLKRRPTPVPFTAEQGKQIRDLHAAGATTNEIAETLGRDYSTIRDQYVKYDIIANPAIGSKRAVPKKWSDEDIRIVREALRDELPRSSLYKMLPNRTREAVVACVHRLRREEGLSTGRSSHARRLWTKDEESTLMRMYARQEKYGSPSTVQIANEIGRTVPAITKKLYVLRHAANRSMADTWDDVPPEDVK